MVIEDELEGGWGTVGPGHRQLLLQIVKGKMIIISLLLDGVVFEWVT